VFEATGASEAGFLRLARRFLGPEVPAVELVHTGAIPLPALQPSIPTEGDA
jgi:glutamate racemase